MKRFVLVILSLLLSGCSNIAVLDPKSTTGEEQAFLIWLSLGIMTIVILVVFVLFAWFTYKYRYTKSKDGFIPVDVKGNLKLELTWTIIPFILLAILAVPAVITTYKHSPELEGDASHDEDGVHINVTGQQFTWTFEHENGKEVNDELYIPEGEKIVFHVTATDVIHSFWIPRLAGKVDAIPGRVYTYEINNAEQGTYRGKCAEYCGVQHANMVFDTKVVSKEKYQKYLKKPDNQDN